MNTKPPEKPSMHQDKVPPAPKTEVIEKPGKSRGVLLRRVVLPMIPIFVIIFIIAAPLAWLVTPSPSTQPKYRSPASSTTPESSSDVSPSTQTVAEVESDQRIVKSSLSEEAKPPPPPPNVYWSVLSQQLLDLEKERATIIRLLAERLPPPSKPNVDETLNSVTVSEGKVASAEKVTVAKTVVTASEPSVPPPPPAVTEITWATIGQQVLELEKQRESTMTAVANKLKQN